MMMYGIENLKREKQSEELSGDPNVILNLYAWLTVHHL